MKILVFDIGGTAIKYGISYDGILSNVCSTPTNAKLGADHIVSVLMGLIQKETGFQAIGISTAGQVNPEGGFIKYANSNIPGYTGTKLREIIESKYHVPVYVENDVNSAAVGEAAFGAGKGINNFLMLTYGTGIGGAIISNGELYHGSSFSAGEFGALVTHGSHKKGDDFFNGCYEKYASTTALVNTAKKYDSSLTNGKIIFDRINDDARINEIVDSWVDEILLGLSSLIHIFNPSHIVLGGGICVQPLLLSKINDRINNYVMPSFLPVSIKAATLGNSAGLLGAGHLAYEYAKKKGN